LSLKKEKAEERIRPKGEENALILRVECKKRRENLQLRVGTKPKRGPDRSVKKRGGFTRKKGTDPTGCKSEADSS